MLRRFGSLLYNLECRYLFDLAFSQMVGIELNRLPELTLQADPIPVMQTYVGQRRIAFTELWL